MGVPFGSSNGIKDTVACLTDVVCQPRDNGRQCTLSDRIRAPWVSRPSEDGRPGRKISIRPVTPGASGGSYSISNSAPHSRHEARTTRPDVVVSMLVRPQTIQRLTE